jgi:drug/metabolite transporter (DMT)-like permease
MLVLLAAATAFGVMALFVKLATETLRGSEVAVFRFAVALVPVLLLPSVRRDAFRFDRPRPLLLRGLFGGLAVLLYFTAISRIPIGVAALLNTTAPVFSGIFAAIFLGERLRLQVVVPLAVTISGIFLVVQGHSAPGREVFGFGAGEAFALASAVCAGAALTAMRGARRTERTWSTVTSLSLFGIAITAPLAIVNWTWPSPREWLLVLLAGAFGLLGQLLLTWAYRWVETMIAGIVSQFTVIIAMALGVVFVGDRMNVLTIAGTLITIGGVASVIALTRNRPQLIAPAIPGSQP